MLQNLSVETVKTVIRLAAASVDSAPADEGGMLTPELVEKSLRVTPEERALLDFLEALPRNQMAELMALMWLGRGSGGEQRKDFPGLVTHANMTIDDAAEYVAAKAPLAEYLEDGLAKLEA